MRCDTDTVCGTGDDQNTHLTSYYIEKSSMFYIDNWVEQLNMQCMKGAYIGLIGAMAFAGVAISCFIIPSMGDKYGRLQVFVATIFLQLPLYLLAIFTDNIGVVYFACFYLGMGLIGRFTCGFVLLTESLPKKHQMMGGTISMIGDVVATLYVTFYLRYISNNVNSLIWVGFSLNIVAFIMTFWIVESPAWLVSVGRKAEAIKKLQFIAKMNGQKNFHISALRDQTFETVEKE